MNIGICINQRETDLRDQFVQAASQGFHHCQLLSWEPSLWTDEQAELIRGLCLAHDVTITAFWCGWVGPKQWNFIDGPETLGLVPVSYRMVRMQNLMDGADFALKLGIRDVISHMGFIPEAPSDPNYPGLVAALRAVAEHLRDNGQNLLFETGQETPVAMLRIFEDVNTGNLFVNLDPANLILYGKANPVDALDVFGRYVRGVHAKDGKYPTDGRHLGEEVKVGEGKVDFSALLLKLKKLGYNGSLTIEREISGEQQVNDILDARAYLQKIIDRG